MPESQPVATEPTDAAGYLERTFAADDGYPVYFRHYPAEGQPRAVVVCIHGIQSHAGWYVRSCRSMAEAGLETFFVDRRGSGQNTRDRGHCRGYKQLTGDLVRSVEFVRDRCPGLPVVLLGISWGGKLAVAALKKRPDLVDALVLMCPGFFAKVSPTLREKLAIGLSFLLFPRREFDIPLSDPALFTETVVWQTFLANDPLSLRRGSARLLATSRFLDRVIADAPQQITVPSLLLLAGRDRIIDNLRTRAYFERFAATNKKILEYPQAHHTLEFESDPTPIFADLIEWVECIPSSG